MIFADWLRTDHPLAEEVEVMQGLARALSEAHDVGQARGDAIAPSRIDIGSGNQIHFEGAPTELVESNYRPPELADGGEPTPQSDVFAAGALFYEILTGKHPYAGESLTGMLVVDFDVQPEHLRQKRSDIPGDLADAVMACIEKDPEWRAKDLDYVVEMLSKVQSSSTGRPRGPAASASPRGGTIRPTPRTAAPAPRTTITPPRAASSGGGGLYGAIAAVVLVGVAGTVWYLMGGQSEPVPVPTPPPTTQVASAEASPTPEEEEAAASGAPATPTPAPTALPETTPEPTPAATPEPTPTAATPAPLRTPAPTPRPTSTPTPAPTPTPLPVPKEPATLSHMAPPSFQARPTVLVDVHGTGLRTDLRAVVLRAGAPSADVTVGGLKVASPEKIQLLLKIASGAPVGDYALQLVDTAGTTTNAIRFKLEK
jgi:serine/threonine protein kinase